VSRVPKDSKFGRTSMPGALYDRHGPIPVPDAIESDSESAWAMFEESVLHQDDPVTRREDLHPNFEDTNQDLPDFEPTGFEQTKIPPLTP
jgi:hypothetical protein